MTPLISIVMVTRNGAATLPDTLAALQRQRIDAPWELIAIDSGSTDGTRDLLEQAGARVVSIAPDTFNHGLTRNLGVEHARGELVVLLVQDARPASDDWLAHLVAPLRDNARVAGAYCRQTPRPDATALTRLYLERWSGTSTTPRRVELEDPSALDRLPPLARMERCTFDNVCSCIRRSVWVDTPFAATTIAEDLEWARAVLQQGHALVFAADATVVHSHDRPASYEFWRTWLLHRRLFELFGVRTIPRVSDLLRSIASCVRLHLRCEREARAAGGQTMPPGRALALAVAWPLGQYLAGLSASRGWAPPRVRGV